MKDGRVEVFGNKFEARDAADQFVRDQILPFLLGEFSLLTNGDPMLRITNGVAEEIPSGARRISPESIQRLFNQFNIRPIEYIGNDLYFKDSDGDLSNHHIQYTRTSKNESVWILSAGYINDRQTFIKGFLYTKNDESGRVVDSSLLAEAQTQTNREIFLSDQDHFEQFKDVWLFKEVVAAVQKTTTA